MQPFRTHRRRGASAIEILVATGITLLIPPAIAGMTVLARSTWSRSEAAVSVKQALHVAVARMEPDIRAAMRVDLSRSDSDRLTVILPRMEESGQYRVPLEEGPAATFRLSNREGTVGAQGTWFWRYVDGVRDDNWTPVNLGTPFLQFQYVGTTEVKSVRVTLKAERQYAARDSASQLAFKEVFLRNRAYAE
jgi:hypothetical protein